MTTEAKKILELIESVDPADSAALDEIDARVWCFKKGLLFQRQWKSKNMGNCVKGYDSEHVELCVPKYTRSRDALKAIRPEGCTILIHGYKPEQWTGIAYRHTDNNRFSAPSFLPTEELAELHAIIQAIEYNRGQE